MVVKAQVKDFGAVQWLESVFPLQGVQVRVPDLSSMVQQRNQQQQKTPQVS